MSLGFNPPTTVTGIKRLAKQIKKERGCQHIKALNQAASIAGFENFTHAKKELEKNNG